MVADENQIVEDIMTLHWEISDALNGEAYDEFISIMGTQKVMPYKK